MAADVEEKHDPYLSGSLRECQHPCDDKAHPGHTIRPTDSRELSTVTASPDSVNILNCTKMKKLICIFIVPLPVDSGLNK